MVLFNLFYNISSPNRSLIALITVLSSIIHVSIFAHTTTAWPRCLAAMPQTRLIVSFLVDLL